MAQNKLKPGGPFMQNAGLARYLTVAEVAGSLRRSPRTIRDWIEDGCPTPQGRVRLEAVKFGRSWSIKHEWLEIFEYRVRPPAMRAASKLDDEE